MEFVFRISRYDDPSLEEETTRLLARRLEIRSREAIPGLWKAIDNLNAYAAKGPGRETRRVRYRVYGVLLTSMGIFVLIPGLLEPRTPALIAAGIIGIFSGVIEFCLTRKKRIPALPVSCHQEAVRRRSQRRSIDWNLPENCTELRFDETGLSVLAGEKEDTVPYGEMTAIFETERLWLLLYGGEQAILLQRKDLTAGDEAEFEPYLREKIATSMMTQGKGEYHEERTAKDL